MLRHGGDKFVKHAALTEQRVSASRAHIGFEVPVVAERLASRAEQGQQDDGEGVDQLEAVAPVGGADVHGAHPHAEAQVVRIAERALAVSRVARHQGCFMFLACTHTTVATG